MKISVVIPAYNEESYLRRTIESLKNQSLKANEIIVVDNGSTDKTKEVAKSLGAKVIAEEKKGVGFARKAGFEKAFYDIIVTTDADTAFPKNWLSRIEKTFTENPRVIAVGGPYQFDTEKHKLAIKIMTKVWIWGDKILNLGNNIPGVNMAVLKKAYLKTKGFRKKYYEDLDLSLQLKKQGKVVFLKNLVVTTSYRRYAKKGFLKTVWEYMKNYYGVRFKKSDIHVEDVRETR